MRQDFMDKRFMTLMHCSSAKYFRHPMAQPPLLHFLHPISGLDKTANAGEPAVGMHWGSQEAETDFLTGLMNRLEAICLRALVVEIQYSRASGFAGGMGIRASSSRQFVGNISAGRRTDAAVFLGSVSAVI